MLVCSSSTTIIGPFTNEVTLHHLAFDLLHFSLLSFASDCLRNEKNISTVTLISDGSGNLETVCLVAMDIGSQ